MHRKRGRYAPSPTGLLHVGNARTALAAWLSVRSQDGICVWRLEDLDTPRVIPGAAEAAERDLKWLGLDWDEGVTQQGPYAPYAQSQRTSYYEDALKVLFARGYLFPCRYSRKDVQQLSTAPHGSMTSPPYPVSLRPVHVEENWFEQILQNSGENDSSSYVAIRFKVDDRDVALEDVVYGASLENVRNTVGDFVVRRKDGMIAYQLAVVVDDIAMRINEVVRGTDLLDSTARQMLLIDALGGTQPAYAHVPLVRNADEQKLSKRDQSLTLAALRERGVRPEQLLGYMAYSLGLIDTLRTCTLDELVTSFSWDRVTREDWVLPERFYEHLARLS